MEFADEQRVAGEEMIAHEQKKHSYFSMGIPVMADRHSI